MNRRNFLKTTSGVALAVLGTEAYSVQGRSKYPVELKEVFLEFESEEALLKHSIDFYGSVNSPTPSSQMMKATAIERLEGDFQKNFGPYKFWALYIEKKRGIELLNSMWVNGGRLLGDQIELAGVFQETPGIHRWIDIFKPQSKVEWMSVLPLYTHHVTCCAHGGFPDLYVDVLHAYKNFSAAPIMDSVLVKTRGILVWKSQLKHVLSAYGVPDSEIEWISDGLPTGLVTAYEYLDAVSFDGVNVQQRFAEAISTRSLGSYLGYTYDQETSPLLEWASAPRLNLS